MDPYAALRRNRSQDMEKARDCLKHYRRTGIQWWADWFLMHARSHRAYSRLLWERGQK